MEIQKSWALPAAKLRKTVLKLPGRRAWLSNGISILRYRLWDIDVIINRTLVYGGLTAVTVLCYILVVGLLGTFFQAQRNLLISLITTGIVAILFQPLRSRRTHCPG